MENNSSKEEETTKEIVVFTIGITAEQHKILKEQAKICNIRVSDIIRQLIEDHRIWD